MPRGFADLKALVDAFRLDVKQLVACFQKFKATIEEYPVVQRMAMSIVALNVVAAIVDYYITKYVTKPMEQLQNLTTQYALGMRRLEEKEEREKATRLEAGGLTGPANRVDELKRRSWRVLVTF